MNERHWGRADSREGPVVTEHLSLRSTVEGHRVVIVARGSLRGREARRISETIAELVAAGGRLDVMIDLAAVSSVDESGVAALARAHAWLREKGGRLVLVNPTGDTLRSIEAAGRLSVFEFSAPPGPEVGGTG